MLIYIFVFIEILFNFQVDLRNIKYFTDLIHYM